MLLSSRARPALRYHGSKWQLVGWILENMPPNYRKMHYVDVCGGGAAVLLRKPPSKLETYNDIDGEAVNFFQVVRDSADLLIPRLQLTPYSRAEYDGSFHPSENDDPIERARRFFVRCWQSRNGATDERRKGWKYQKRPAGRHTPPSADFAGAVVNLYAVAQRLLHVHFEQLDVLDIIRIYDSADTIFYYDPPYSPKNRGNKVSYQFEMSPEKRRQCCKCARDG